MKKWCLLLLCFRAGTVAAQQVVVANLKENVVYCGVDNPLSALVAGYPCSSVVLTTDNGKITKAGCGIFIYQPAEPGMVKIKVWIKNGKRLKKVEEVPYRVKQSPPPVAVVGSYMGGNIPTKVFKAMGGVRVWINCSDAPLQADSFTITLFRDKKPVFWLDNIGPRFSNEVMNALQDLMVEDIIFLTAIKVTMPNGETEEISPLRFTITN